MKKILVVDDEEIVRYALSEKLKENGFLVTEACDGEQAVEIFQKEELDSVLLDLKMPGMSGIETMKELKKLDISVPVIIVTAHGDIPTAVEAIRFGAYDFVEKPPQVSKIIVTLNRAIEKAELEKKVRSLGLALESSKEMQTAYEKLKELDKMKTDFVSTVSHEFRTPLTSILGFTKIIQGKLETVIFPQVISDDKKTKNTVNQIKENISIVLSETERLTALINDVLDLAKIESGKVEWKMVPLDASSIIRQAFAITGSFFTQKGLELFEDIEEDLPEISGDNDRLLQVLINLLSNAAKFTEKGSITCRAKKTGNHITFSIIDTGIGIDIDDQKKILEKFKQAGDTLTNKPKGTGLGLPICREIIENHGGRIWVDSEPGKGSSFLFTIPIIQTVEQEI